jgi:hypothetical protein
METKTVYTVHAFRFGDRERHSYIVGVYSDATQALRAAIIEKDHRGGKYDCEVLEWMLDKGTEGSRYIDGKDYLAKTILELPCNK